MVNLLYRLARPLFFLLDPESAHKLVLFSLWLLFKLPFADRLVGAFCRLDDARLRRRAFGLDFPNPVGLAAGMDKDAAHVDAFAALGFGFVEIGTVTPQAQPGNPLPRLYRLPTKQAIINRMGFNNRGLAAAVSKLRRRRASAQRVLVGGNLGKNKVTPNESAIADYEAGFLALHDVVDYFAVNVSSPNTPNLRELQDREPLTALLSHLQRLNSAQDPPKPILLKIAPDLTNEQLDDILAIVQETGIAGIIATNTTVSREGLDPLPPKFIEEIGPGGLSGAPLRDRATEVIRYLHEQSHGKVPIIGVGGILSPADALAKLAAGACLVQLYTGIIYEGPGLVKRINQAILEADG